MVTSISILGASGAWPANGYGVATETLAFVFGAAEELAKRAALTEGSFERMYLGTPPSIPYIKVMFVDRRITVEAIRP